MNSNDPIWEGATLGILSYAEEYIGIIAACIPCLKSLFEKLFRRLGGHITSMTTASHADSHNDPTISFQDNRHSARNSRNHALPGSNPWQDAPLGSNESILLTGFEKAQDMKMSSIAKQV